MSRGSDKDSDKDADDAEPAPASEPAISFGETDGGLMQALLLAAQAEAPADQKVTDQAAVTEAIADSAIAQIEASPLRA